MPRLAFAGYGRDPLSPNASFSLGNSTSIASPNVGFPSAQDSYHMVPPNSSPLLGSNGNDWQHHNQYQQLVTQQALLNQLQSQMQIGQVINCQTQSFLLASCHSEDLIPLALLLPTS